MIYLLRHFKVKDISKNRLNSQEFNDWVKDYDNFELEYIDIDIPKDIDDIYVSSQNRAIKTAEYLNLTYQTSELLAEVGVKAFIDTNLKLPKWLWLSVGRVLWYFDFTSSENRSNTKSRINDFISQIDFEKNTLIISHGFFMTFLIKKLKSLGFTGDIDVRVKNAKVYTLYAKQGVIL
jgi:broad specificity phosphatase PhoE